MPKYELVKKIQVYHLYPAKPIRRVLPNFISLCLLCFLPHIQAQAINQDSLWGVWHSTSTNDTSKLQALYNLSWDVYLFSKPDSAFILSEMILDRAIQIESKKWQAKALNILGASTWITGEYDKALSYFNRKLDLNLEENNNKEIAKSYNNIGLIYHEKGDYTEALEYHQKSLKIKTLLKDTIGMANSKNNIGIVLQKKGDYPQALAYQHSALKLRERFPNKQQLANSYNNIGTIYELIQDHEASLKYHKKSLELFEEIGNKKGLAEVNNNIGNVYQAKKENVEALEYYTKSLQLYKEIRDKKGIAISYSNLGIIYLKNEDFTSASFYLEQSAALFEQIQDQQGIADAYQELGHLMIKKKQYQKAIDWCNKGYVLAKKINDLPYTKECVKCLFTAYENVNEFKKALNFYQEFKLLSDSIFNETNSQKIVNLEMKFEHEKETAQLQQKQQERLHQAQLKQARTKLFSIISLGVLLSLFFLLLFRISRKSNERLKIKNQELVVAKKLTEEKNQKLKQYIESNKQLENFAYIASHDLKAPIRSIMSFSQLLNISLKDKLSEEESEYLAFIRNSAKNMQRLIDDLLTYSKVKAAKVQIKEFNPKHLMEVLLHELQVSVKEKEAKIEVSNFPAAIKVDKMKFRQLLQNLISNAIKFVPKDIKPNIHVSCKEEEKSWLFTIKDNGIGIKKEYHNEVFNFFTRLHSADKFEGSGIGLAICKKIVEQHNGDIWIESELGQGASFYFTIHKFLS